MNEDAYKILNETLEKISLCFGADSFVLNIPDGTLVNLPLDMITTIDVSNLKRELSEQPKIYGLFSALYRYGVAQQLLAEANLERSHAELSLSHEEALRNSKTAKRVTDKKIKALAEADPRYLDIKDGCIRWKGIVKQLEGIVETVSKRGEKLSQLSAGEVARTMKGFPSDRSAYQNQKPLQMRKLND